MTNIDTGGGSYTEGDVTAGRDFIGRDKNELHINFLGPIDSAADSVAQIAGAWEVLHDAEAYEVKTTIADLTSLMEELRRTHATIVKLISPLRRIPDDVTAFADAFRQYYFDFRDFCDAYDFNTERTRCHKIRQIMYRLTRRKPTFGSVASWQQLYDSLQPLLNADQDLIEHLYVPFMHTFDQTMKHIDEHIEKGEIVLAIEEKRAFLNGLADSYAQTKAKLEEMTDTIGKLTIGL